MSEWQDGWYVMRSHKDPAYSQRLLVIGGKPVSVVSSTDTGDRWSDYRDLGLNIDWAYVGPLPAGQ